MKKWILLVVLVVVVFGGGCCVVGLQRQMMFPGGPIAFPSAEKLTAAYPRFGGIVEYEAADGTQLRGAWLKSGNPDARVALYFHGNGESAAQNVPFANELAERGIDVFLAEYRGYGGLGGSPSEKGLYQDALAALAQIHKAGVPKERVILVGRSLGSGVATELAHQSQGAALVLVSPYTSMVDMGRGMVGPLARLLVVDKFDNLAKIGSIDMPVVIIHGTRDEVIPYEMGKRVAAASRRARFITLDGFGHNNIGLADLAARIVSALDDRSL